MNGIGIHLGHSVGGWGNRQDSVDWIGEVCDTCYAEYLVIADAVNLWLSKRAGVRAPEIIISDVEVTVSANVGPKQIE